MFEIGQLLLGFFDSLAMLAAFVHGKFPLQLGVLGLQM
jgi:hypothetical protein